MEPERLAPTLRALAAAALARLPDEALLHRKRLLAEHAEEDLAAAGWLEAAGGGGTPLDLPPGHAEAKRALAAHVRELCRHAEPTQLEVLVPLAIDQQRHAEELPDRHGSAGRREPYVLTDPEAPPDPIEDAIAAAEAAARGGDAHAAAEHLRHAARQDGERARRGDPWGARPVRLS